MLTDGTEILYREVSEQNNNLFSPFYLKNK